MCLFSRFHTTQALSDTFLAPFHFYPQKLVHCLIADHRHHHPCLFRHIYFKLCHHVIRICVFDLNNYCPGCKFPFLMLHVQILFECDWKVAIPISKLCSFLPIYQSVLFPPIFTQFIKTFFSDDPLMVIANYYFGQWPVFNTWQVQPKYALVMTTKKRTPGPNFIELLSEEICSVGNDCLDENRITNQISMWFSGFISKQQLITSNKQYATSEHLVGNPVLLKEEI